MLRTHDVVIEGTIGNHPAITLPFTTLYFHPHLTISQWMLLISCLPIVAPLMLTAPTPIVASVVLEEQQNFVFSANKAPACRACSSQRHPRLSGTSIRALKQLLICHQVKFLRILVHITLTQWAINAWIFVRTTTTLKIAELIIICTFYTLAINN